jgi:holliday junction DNA helicase RuvA
MIARLKGVLDSVGDDWLIIDVGGVGYMVFASGRTLASLPAPGGALSLHIETHVREDHFHLFGFADHAELDMFKLVQTVQGVGAKVALGILSVLDPEALSSAIAAGDKVAICRANGVGPKLGQRIVMELKDKAASIVMPGHVALGGVTTRGNGPIGDAVSALVNLGYGASQAHSAVAMVARDADGEMKVEELIRLGLKELAH